MLSSAELFDQILENLKVSNYQEIANRRDEITKSLNGEYREGDPGSTAHRLMVGSYGRHTAIDGVSDLDLLYTLPSKLRNKYRSPEGPYRALKRTKDAIVRRYPTTDVSVSQLVVAVKFQNFTFEVQPVFQEKDGDFAYPDTKKKLWLRTKPRKEIEAIKDFNAESSGSLRALCRLTRSWKNKHDVHIGGLLIDTLAFNFLKHNEQYQNGKYYDQMFADFLDWLSNEPCKSYYLAPGSNQQVRVKQAFQRKASAAHELAMKAFESEESVSYAQRWRELLGKPVPLSDAQKSRNRDYVDTEQFIEDYYPQNIRYTLDIDCSVKSQEESTWLSDLLRRRLRLPHDRKLIFKVTFCDVPEPFELKWKVLNQGDQARERDMIRGSILDDNGSQSLEESSDFYGDHFVECYAIKDGALVARAHISVPIE
ncbi:nucleotide-binding domain-containing protein [Stomatohabitans albus]|uniref:nucleotide-binding domain-containing protein n=1 Tax=Stomatohabitans albus TaxID=3110766 RepID=UPI00300CD2C4